MKKIIVTSFLLLVLLAVLTMTSTLGEMPMILKLAKKEGKLWVQTLNTEYSKEKLQKDLKSGMPITLSTFVNVGGMLTRQKEIKCLYDLWEETYNISISIDNQTRTLKLKKLEDAVKIFVELEWPLAELSQFVSGRQYQVDVFLVMNPLDQNKIAKLKELLLKNSVAGDGERQKTGSGGSSGPRLKGLFSTILNQYTKDGKGNVSVGLWQKNMSLQVQLKEGK